MADDLKFEGRLWAIVGTGQKQYIGQVEHPKEYMGDAAELTELQKQGENLPPTRCLAECPPYIELYPCYELLSLTRMMQFPDGTASPKRDVLVLPIDRCSRDVRKRFRPVELTWAEDIHEMDRSTYINLIRDLRQQALEARGQESGLAKPPPGFDPTKLPFPIPGGFQGGPPFGRP
jgi:hypothetical protein